MKNFEEKILPDDYPIYYKYWYLYDGIPKQSEMAGRCSRAKELTGAKEIKSCDVIGRGFLDGH